MGLCKNFARRRHLLHIRLPDGRLSKASLLRVAEKKKAGARGRSPVGGLALSVVAAPSRAHAKLNYLNLLTCAASAWRSGDLLRPPLLLL